MAPLSRMLQTCYTGGTGRYTKWGDTMTCHALPRIYSPPNSNRRTPRTGPPYLHIRWRLGPGPPGAPLGLGAAWGMGATMRGLRLQPGGAGRVLAGVGEKWARETPAKPGGLAGETLDSLPVG